MNSIQIFFLLVTSCLVVSGNEVPHEYVYSVDNLKTTGNLKEPISTENRDYAGNLMQKNAFKSSTQTDLDAQVNREPVVMASKTADSVEPVISFSPKFQHHSQSIMTPAPISIADELGPSHILTNPPMSKTRLVDEIQAPSESLALNLSTAEIEPAHFNSAVSMADPMSQTRLVNEPALLNIARSSPLPTQMLQKTDFGSESPALWESRIVNAPIPTTLETDNIKYDASPIEQTKLAASPSTGLSYSSPLIYNKMATTMLKRPSIDISNQYSDPIMPYSMPLSTFPNQPFDSKVMMTDKLDTSFSQYYPATPAKSIESLPTGFRLQTPSEYEPLSPAPILRTTEIEHNPSISTAPMASTPLLKIRLAKAATSLNAPRRPVVSKQMLQDIGFSSADLFETRLEDDSVPNALKALKYNANPIGQNRFAVLPMANTEYQSQYITPN